MGHLRRLGPWLAVAIAGGVGCNAPAQRPKPDPSVEGLAVLTPEAELQVAHTLLVELRLRTDHAAEAVGIAYRAFPRAQWDVHDPEIVSWVLGAAAHDVPGRHGLSTDELEIPYDMPAGDYYLVAEIDPAGLLDESDETDQLSDPVAFTVRDDHRDEVRLMASRAVLDTPAFELSFVTTATPPEPLGLTVVVEAEAATAVAGAGLTACLRAPGGACSDLPFGIWQGSAAEGGYVPRLALPELSPGDPTSLHLDLRLDPSLEPAFAALERTVAEACIADVAACAAQFGLDAVEAQACVDAGTLPSGDVDHGTIDPCFLKLVPFTVEVTVQGAPGVVLYDPPNAEPGRTVAVPLQLTAPPVVTPLLTPLRIRPLADPIFRRVGIEAPHCDRDALELVADKGACAEPVVWSAGTLPGWTAPWSRGQLVGTDTSAVYTPYRTPAGDAGAFYSCIDTGGPGPYDGVNKILVTATACGQVATLVVTEVGGPGAAVTPESVELAPGAPGTVTFKELLDDCVASATDTTWSLVEASDGTLGTLEPTANARIVRYRPPPRLDRPSATVTVRATSPGCQFTGDARVTISQPSTLAFEKAYTKGFGGDFFGAGVDLYAGAFVNAAGAQARARAKVPVAIFGANLTLLDVREDADVDPRTGGTSTFTHDLEVFGSSVSSLRCPGSATCTGEWPLWSESKCVPDGPPRLCLGAEYVKPCKTSADCKGVGSGLTCKDQKCTKKCDENSDCPAGICDPSPVTTSSYRRTFVIVVVPVTVEGRVCAELGVQTGINLLDPDPATLAFRMGPYVEVNGYAAASVGYPGIFAVGVRGEIVLVRDDFYGEVRATLEVVEQGQRGCLLERGCIQGMLQESVNNVLQGGSGQIYLFVDYPTLRWCGWYPCFGMAQARRTLASWGSLYEVENRCDFCAADLTCADGSTCLGLECADGGLGILCRQQSYFMTAAQ